MNNIVLDPKKFSPHRFTIGVVLIPLLAIVLDMVIRLVMTQVVLFTKGAAIFTSMMSLEDFSQAMLSFVEENFHLISSLYSICQIFLFVGFFVLFRKRSTPYLFRRAPQPFVWPMLPVFVLAGIGITSLWMTLVETLSTTSTYWQDVIASYEVVGASLMTRDSYLLQFLSVVILVPIAEELLFRGIIVSELKQVMKAEWAVVFSAIIFGIFHANVLQGVYAFLVGILIGIVYVWTESIWSAIVMHMIFNFYGGSLLDLLGIEQEQQAFYGWYNLLPLIMIFVAIPLFVYLYQHRRSGLTVTRHSKYSYAMQALHLLATEKEQELSSADQVPCVDVPPTENVLENVLLNENVPSSEDVDEGQL